jgi:hypothetical protein
MRFIIITSTGMDKTCQDHITFINVSGYFDKEFFKIPVDVKSFNEALGKLIINSLGILLSSCETVQCYRQFPVIL